MTKTITVKGVGKVSVKPDYVVVSLALESKDKEYEKAMNIANEQMDRLNKTLSDIGFEKEDLKTTNFNVRTNYESKRDSEDNYKQIFAGYLVMHDLKVSFDFDMEKLAKTLSAISKCISKPNLSIRFTVKDSDAVNEELLVSATKNAKRKAKTLCKAANVKLGELKKIDYNWGQLNIYSDTSYDIEYKVLSVERESNIEIVPDDINASDTATFVWEIK